MSADWERQNFHHGGTENSRKIAKVGKNPTTDEQGWEEIAKIAEIEKQKLYRGLTRMFADWEKAELSPTEARRKSGYGNLYKSARFESGTQKTGVKGHPRSPQPRAKS
jgi:hypothetical protein